MRLTRQEERFLSTINPVYLVLAGGGEEPAAAGGASIIGASERLHSNLPIPVLALQYPKPIALDGLVFDGDRIVSRCPYAIVATQFQVLEF